MERVRAAGNNDLFAVANSQVRFQVPGEVSQDLTHFTTDPRRLLEHRDRMARMIERLQKLR